MAKLSFQDLSFEMRNGMLRVWFLKIFCFDVDKSFLADLGAFRVNEHTIYFETLTDDDARNRFQTVLDLGFKDLKNSITNKPTVYVHKNSRIPLIGNVGFGIIDRNTTLIEVKPITGCNLDCIFCSVDQSKRLCDFVIEKDYLVEELRKLVDFKQASGLEIHINSHGEPMFYSPLADFIKDISSWKEISTISMDTNATLLTENKVDELVAAGITRFNISLNAVSQETAEKMAGCAYDVEKIKNICRYVSKKCELLIAPVLVPDMNEQELPGLIEFSKSLNARIGIQNFLSYRLGKRPAKSFPMKKFYTLLNELEKKHEVKLVFNDADFMIRKTKVLPKPFKKGQTVEAVIVYPGRMKNEKIAASLGRSITVMNCDRVGIVTVKITGDKHNIFYGALIKR